MKAVSECFKFSHHGRFVTAELKGMEEYFEAPVSEYLAQEVA